MSFARFYFDFLDSLFSVDIIFSTNIIAVLPLEKLQSSKIFVVSNLQVEVKTAEQRNINKHFKTDAILNFIG